MTAPAVNLTGYSAKLRLYTTTVPNILTLTTTLDVTGNVYRNANWVGFDQLYSVRSDV